MTARDLLRVVLRRWYLMVMGAILTLGAAYLVTHQPGVYWTQFNVVLLAPAEQMRQNRVQDPQHDLAPMAGLIAAEWNGSDRVGLAASGETTLFGEGKRNAVRVRVVNQGNQWRPMYGSPNIDVQVTAGDPETVTAEAHRVAQELDGMLQRKQDDMGVLSSMRMTTITSPAEPTVYYASGSRVRALASVGLVGAILTTLAVYWIDRLLPLRGRWRLNQLQLFTRGGSIQ